MKWIKIKKHLNWFEHFMEYKKAPYKIKYKEFDEYGTITAAYYNDKKSFEKKLKELEKREDIIWIKYKIKEEE